MTTKRKPLSKKTRFEVFKRDAFRCMYCGAHPPAVLLEADHIVPVAGGGTNDMDNLVTACEGCNRGKAAVSLDVVPKSLATRAAEVKEREEQIRGFEAVMASSRNRIEDESFQVMGMFADHFGDETFLKVQRTSVKTFLKKIGLSECIEAMEIALGRFPDARQRAFAYFCGVCWSKVRELGADA